MFTGNFPVHDAPPINVLVSGFLGESLAPACELARALVGSSAPAFPFLAFFEALLGSPKMTLSSSFGMDVGFGFLELAPRPPPLGIFQTNTTDKSIGAVGIHEANLWL